MHEAIIILGAISSISLFVIATCFTLLLTRDNKTPPRNIKVKYPEEEKQKNKIKKKEEAAWQTPPKRYRAKAYE